MKKWIKNEKMDKKRKKLILFLLKPFKNYLKTILVVSFGFACLSIILNLLEEQNFFKDHDYSNILLPLLHVLHIK